MSDALLGHVEPGLLDAAVQPQLALDAGLHAGVSRALYALIVGLREAGGRRERRIGRQRDLRKEVVEESLHTDVIQSLGGIAVVDDGEDAYLALIRECLALDAHIAHQLILADGRLPVETGVLTEDVALAKAVVHLRDVEAQAWRQTGDVAHEVDQVAQVVGHAHLRLARLAVALPGGFFALAERGTGAEAVEGLMARQLLRGIEIIVERVDPRQGTDEGELLALGREVEAREGHDLADQEVVDVLADVNRVAHHHVSLLVETLQLER